MLSLPTLIFAITASYLIQFAVFIGWGTLIAYVIREPDQSIFGTLLLGLFGVTFALLTIHFFWPINFVVAVTVALPAGIGLYLFVKQIYKLELLFNWQSIFIGIIFIVSIGYLPSAEFINIDTGLYHAQKVLWYGEEPIWPGLALLHSRFGFNVSFFLPIAMLRHIVPYSEAIHYSASSFWVFAFIMHLWNCAFSTHISRLKHFFSILFFLTFIYPFLGSSVWGFSPDPIITVSILFLLIRTFFTIISGQFILPISLLLITSVAISVKLSATILLLPLFSFLLTKRIRQIFQKQIFLSLAIIAPFTLFYIFHGYLESGYFSYPAPFTVGLPTWQILDNNRIIESQWVTAWARTFGKISLEDSLNGFQWIKIWLSKPTNLAILILLISSLFISFTILSLKRESKEYQKLIVFNLLLWSSIIAWFFIAPDKRFGLPIIIFIIGFSIYLIHQALPTLLDQLPIFHFSFIMVILIPITLSSYRLFSYSEVPHYIALPTLEIRQPTDNNLLNNNVQLCWAAPRPCSPHIVENLQITPYQFGPFTRYGYILK